ncbi:MAG: MBL fold metallo-hydrolase [Solirubrobacterales bacterium]
MKIITLLENRTISKEYDTRHGLSLYIETFNHKILFDMGPDATFAKNAVKLGVDLKEVDIAVISHGHYDHGGGLETFLKLNSKASIYIGKGAFNKHYKKILRYFNYNIGLNNKLVYNNRITFVDEFLKIDEELILFGDIQGNLLYPPGNKTLYKKYAVGVKRDDFQHEINLLIRENTKHTLFCGCAHKGIINIISKAKLIAADNIDFVLGGFHLMRINQNDSKGFLDELSKYLKSSNALKFYTCHCTGENAYNYLKNDMENLYEIKTGEIIEI